MRPFYGRAWQPDWTKYSRRAWTTVLEKQGDQQGEQGEQLEVTSKVTHKRDQVGQIARLTSTDDASNPNKTYGGLLITRFLACLP